MNGCDKQRGGSFRSNEVERETKAERVPYNQIGIGNDLNNAIRTLSHDPWSTVSWDWNIEPRRIGRFLEVNIVCGEIRVKFQIRTRY